MNGACNVNIFWRRPLGRDQKVKYRLISITNFKSISKIFIPNCMCVLTNERYKTYQTRFSFCCLGHAPWVGLWGAGGAQRVHFSMGRTLGRWGCPEGPFFFFNIGHVAYRIDGDYEQNRMQVKFSS